CNTTSLRVFLLSSATSGSPVLNGNRCPPAREGHCHLLRDGVRRAYLSCTPRPQALRWEVTNANFMAGKDGDPSHAPGGEDELTAATIIQALQGELQGCFAKAQRQLDGTTLKVLHEARATQRIKEVELDLNDQVRQARSCIQALTMKRDNCEVQMNLEEKLSELVHQTGLAHPEREPLCQPIGLTGDIGIPHHTDYYNHADKTRAPVPDGGFARLVQGTMEEPAFLKNKKEDLVTEKPQEVHNNNAYYQASSEPTLLTPPRVAQLVRPDADETQPRGLHAEQDIFEEATSPADEQTGTDNHLLDGNMVEQTGTYFPHQEEESDWNRDSQDEASDLYDNGVERTRKRPRPEK
ncbi:unnamed protein product, partial [Symbiodinium microadriaticum]